MKYISYYLFFWVLCLFSLNVWGQATRINFSNISVIDGLSQSSAFAIAQDSLGYMWFGTFDGLNRYSGYEIQTFKHSDNDSLSLPDNYIQALCVDYSGQLWIGTNSHGICLFDYASEQFIPLSSCAQTSADFQSSSVFTLRIFNDTTIVALTDLGIYFINTHTKNQRRIGSAAYKSLPDAPSLVSYFNPQITDSLTIHTFFVDSKGDKWMGTNVGLWRKIVGRSTWLRYSQNVCYEGAITSNDITCVFEDRGGVLWVGTSLGGVCFWNRINEKVLLYRNSPLDPEGLHGTQIRCFYEDSDEKIWIGTVESGINIWDTKNDIFEHWNVDNNVGLRNNHIRDIDFWNGRYIIATDGSGLQSCTYSDGELQCRDFYEDIIPQNARIWDVYSNDSSLWVGSYSHGLSILFIRLLVRLKYHG
jgi:ligand-binding sensor domain-containing protein